MLQDPKTATAKGSLTTAVVPQVSQDPTVINRLLRVFCEFCNTIVTSINEVSRGQGQRLSHANLNFNEKMHSSNSFDSAYLADHRLPVFFFLHTHLLFVW